MEDRRIAILEMPDSVWVRLFIPWEVWAACTFGLPRDAKLVRAMRDELRGVWRVGIWSAEFDEVPEGQEPPVLPPIGYSTHTCDMPGPLAAVLPKEGRV